MQIEKVDSVGSVRVLSTDHSTMHVVLHSKDGRAVEFLLPRDVAGKLAQALQREEQNYPKALRL